MSIGTPNGILDITGATLRVSKMEFRQSTGFDTVLNNVARNTMLLMDETEQTTSNSWALKLPNAWVAEFHGYWASGSSGAPILFNFYNDSTSGTNGYTLSMNDTTISINYDGGSTLGSATLSSTLNNDAYRKVAIIFERSVLDVSVDGEHVFHFADSQLRDRVYDNNSGYVTFTHSSTDERKLKNLKFTNGDKWVREIDSSNIAYVGGNVGIGTTIPGTKLDVSGTVRGTHLMGDGSAISAIQSSNVSDFGSNVTRIGTLETDLGDNSSRITNLSSNLSDNSSRITALESGDISISGDKTFTGDIIFESNIHMNGGNVLVANTVNMTVSDPIIELGSNNIGANDLGIIMTRPAANSNVAFVYDESDDILRMGYTLNGASDSIVDLDSNALAVSVQGALTAASVSGDGSGLTSLNASNITTGALSTTTVTIDDYLIHDGDTDTKVGFPLADTFAVNTAGSERLRVDSSGNVGIGTASPATPFNINKLTATVNPKAHTTTEFIRLRGDKVIGQTYAISGGIKLGGDTGGTATADGRIEFYANDGADPGNSYGDVPDNFIMCMRGDGNVGIGTSSPLNLLHLSSDNTSLDASGSATFDEYSLIIHNTRGSGSNNTELGLCFNHYDTSYPSSSRTPGAAITHERIDSWSKGKLHFKTKSGNTEAASCDTRMTIDAGGNVGIGTTSPVGKLHLYQSGNGTNMIDKRTNISTSQNRQTLNYTHYSSVAQGPTRDPDNSRGLWIGNMVDENDSAPSGANFVAFTNSFQFYVVADQTKYDDGLSFISNTDTLKYSGGNFIKAMHIDSGGNVGIGTNPGAKLDVNGNIGATHVSLGTTRYPTLGGNWLTIFSPTFHGAIGNNHPDPDGGILFTNQSSGGAFPWGYYMGVVKDVASTNGTTQRFDIGKSNDLNTSDYTSGADTLTPYLTIDNGNVGIGTTSPSTLLDVVGHPHTFIRKMAQAGTATNDYNHILGGPRPGTTSAGAVHFINGSARTSDGGTDTYTIRNDSGKLRLGNASFDTLLEGNVGIGVTSPSVALDISGQLNVSAGLKTIQLFNSNLTVSAGAWNDIGDFSGMSNGCYLLTVRWGNSSNPLVYWYGGASGVIYMRGDANASYNSQAGEDLRLNHWYHYRTVGEFEFILDSDQASGNYGNTTLWVKSAASTTINFTTHMTPLHIV